MHERLREKRIRETYQQIKAWRRLKLRKEERFLWKEEVWIERKKRGIKILRFEMIQIGPYLYIEKCNLIDREGIKEVSSTKSR